MSELQTRSAAPRGRGGFRGGRGGYSSRGGRGAHKSSRHEQENVPPEDLEDQGELGDLKRQYSDKTSTLRAIFPDWTDEDLVYALKETDGDLEVAVGRITDGSIAQWGEVKKKHVDRSKAKTKDSQPPADTTTAGRGSRGRGGTESRGRGRGAGERGRGGRGGRATSQANGSRAASNKNTTESWADAVQMTETATADENLDAPTNGDPPAATDWADAAKEAVSEESKKEEAPSSKPQSWANLFAKKEPVVPKIPAQPAVAEDKQVQPIEENVVGEAVPEAGPPSVPDIAIDHFATNSVPAGSTTDEPVTLTPSKDELTESNLEQLPDISIPPASVTAASTVASTHDPHSALNSAIPGARPGMSGFAASALKATAGQGRSASFQRRVLEQQEAVVMPGGDRAVDRTAVQFGSMGLNGDALDVDEEREDAETRAQPPKDSPVAPRASLPPPPHAQVPLQQLVEPQPDSIVQPRPAPGLPPAPQQPSPGPATSYTDFGRYVQTSQKAYDPFGQPPAQPQHPSHEAYPTTNPAALGSQVTSSAPADYNSFYSAAQPARDHYPNYYGNYGQGQDAHRSGSAFGTAAQESAPQHSTAPVATRFGQDTQNSGQNTPNPALQSQHGQSAQNMPQGQAAHGGYPYAGYPNANYQYPPQYGYMSQMNRHQHQYGSNRPMFDDARRYDDSYMSHNNHYGFNNQYGGPYGKSGMYGHNQPYSYNNSPADVASLSGRESMYGRAGSAQATESQQSTGNTSAFGGMADPFSRSQSGFSGQAQSVAQQQIPAHGGSEDSTGKAYDPTKTGPSPSIAANRPGSAANMQGQQTGQGGFPPPQSQQSGQQQAFGGYPGYGLGGLGGHQTQGHQQHAGYGYGGNQGFGNYGYGNAAGGRGGWAGNYNAH
ncbi:MAG: hypothetical protein Q9227_003555 [Pyrenula ochraceoflavens]